MNNKSANSATILVWLAILIAFSGVAPRANASDQLTSGTNSRKIRQQAVAAIPFQQLTPQMRAKISPIVEKPSIYRRLPVTAIDIDPDYYLYLVRYPEVVVNIWQLLGITQMTLDRSGPFTMNSNDGAGAVSDVELIYGTKNLNIYHATGSYSGPLLKRKLNGSCVLVLRTNYRQGQNGKPQAVSSLDVFLKVENATANLIAKTVNPIVGSSADHNFVESINFVERLSDTTEKNGYGVQRMADRLANLTPDVRKGFVQAAGNAYQRAKKTGGSLPPSGQIGGSQLRNSTAGQPTEYRTPASRAGYEQPARNYQPSTLTPPTGTYSTPSPAQQRLPRFESLNQATRPESAYQQTGQHQIQPTNYSQQPSGASYLANPVFYENSKSQRTYVQPVANIQPTTNIHHRRNYQTPNYPSPSYQQRR